MSSKSLPERLFFKNVREGLETSLGIDTIEQLSQQNEVTLTPLIFQKAQQSIVETLADFKERAARFGLRRGSLTITSQDTGTEINVLTQKAVSQEVSLLKLLFGKPDALDFHTHPTVTKDYLLEQLGKNQTARNEAEGIQISLIRLGVALMGDRNVSIMNLTSLSFSAGDLASTRKFPKIGHASLLGTEHGYRLIIDPHFGLPFRRGQTPAIQEYKQALEDLAAREAIFMEIDGEKTINAEKFREKSDALLLKVCQEQGWLLFGNEDFNSPNLKRIL